MVILNQRQKERKMNKFTIGQKLQTRFIGDSNAVLKAVVVKRTKKFVTLDVEGYRELKRVGVAEYEGAEQCYPLGKYSMAPRFTAS